MAIERSLILLKPDCLGGNHAGEVIGRFEKAGFEIRAAKLIALTDELLKEHYAHIADRPFFPEIVEFMQSLPVIVMTLQGHSAVERVREIVGVTDPAEADEGTIRKQFGTDVMRNVVHASDSVENAEAEIERFFG